MTSGTTIQRCPDCGDVFDSSNGQVLSDYRFHRLRGCSGGGR